MKLLRNPLVVSILAIVAVALCLWQLVPRERWRRMTSRAGVVEPASPARSVTTVALALAPAKANPTNQVAASVEVSTLRPLADRWMRAPRKDPFRVRFQAVRATNGVPASELLTLAAVWHQQESTLAVLNGRVLGEGDRILGFKLDRIEAGGVWVIGANGQEFLTFKANAIKTCPAPVPLGPSASLNVDTNLADLHVLR